MKPSLFAGLLTFCAATTPIAFTAETPPASGKPAVAASSFAGAYTGKWTADTSEGQLRLKLKESGGVWTAETVFTLENAEIPTKVASVKVEGAKVEILVQWENQGMPAQTRLKGTLAGNKIDGTFESKAGEQGLVTGTWTVTRS